ncbi:NrfD/PsrC family molybdoenzyme membrane anchor subunit [Candidatus Magnetobacterium casense]|uniref:NrfD/PsrC family molybdoenzyme membrane anchor subunit n=1 Tax=Candidatus Magnetobacterium casense TaxID=1455061 RepID=UPI0012DEA36E|nr:NrfD/PsrC family molybdoenzyme membrane anchor subunit [Candidatus Magnetobacterium casensis]
MEQIYWNYMIAFYLFAAGISAGALLLSIVAGAINAEKYKGIVRVGAYVAPFPISVGILALVFDLERPWLCWRLFVTFEGTSVMSIGAWLILFFTIVSVLYLYPWLSEARDPLRLSVRLRGFVTHRTVQRFIRYLGIVLSLGVGTYTGVLICTLAARPFWNSPMIPIVFLISAVIDAVAVITLGLYIGHPEDDDLRVNAFFMQCIDFVLLLVLTIVVAFFLVGLYTSTEGAGAALDVVISGQLRLHLWFGVVVLGMVIPLTHVIRQLLPQLPGHNHRHRHRQHPLWTVVTAELCVLIGGYMLRYVVVYAGQLTTANLVVGF